MSLKPKLARALRSLTEAHDRHQERHRPSGFGFVIADSFRYLDGSVWRELTGSSTFFLQPEFLRTVEEAGPKNLQPRYAIIHQAHRPVAAMVAQLVTVRGEQLLAGQTENASSKTDLVRRALLPVARRVSRQIEERVLVCGNLLSWGFHGVAMAPEANAAEVWPAIAEAIYRIRRADRLSGQADLVVVKDITAAHAAGTEALRRFSYRPLETEPNMVLDLDATWRSYEDYLAALDSKYRKSARQILREIDEAGCCVESVNSLEGIKDEIHRLYLQVHENAAVKPLTIPAEFFPALARNAGKDFRCTIIRRGASLVGFVITLRDRETAVGYYIGFDKAAARIAPIYLRLLHAVVTDALALGCRKISLGRTALEPKARLGAQPEPMRIWLRHRVPAMNWIVRSLLGAIPHDEAPARTPFKAARPASE